MTIQLEPSYSANAGKYTGEFEYEGEHGNIKMVMDTGVSEALLLCVGDIVTKFAAQAAERVRDSMILSVAEAKHAPAIENAPAE